MVGLSLEEAVDQRIEELDAIRRARVEVVGWGVVAQSQKRLAHVDQLSNLSLGERETCALADQLPKEGVSNSDVVVEAAVEVVDAVPLAERITELQGELDWVARDFWLVHLAAVPEIGAPLNKEAV